jgi:imidazolonepropionase
MPGDDSDAGRGVSSTALINIGELTTNDPTLGAGILGVREQAALVIEDDRIAWVGSTTMVPATDDVLDGAGRAVLPGFVDSHAHPIFAGDRAAEFVARMTGMPYSAGGIQSTVQATRAASTADLERNAQRLADEFRASGVTTFEAKSGYGLSVSDEARSLVIARGLTEETTFLGAHVVPQEFRDDPDGYVDLVCGAMLDACAPHARWIDVFIEEGAFSAEQARRIIAAGAVAGLAPRVHANQLGHGEGVQCAVAVGAASADHCTYLTDADVDALAHSQTVATLLPVAEFSTRSPYPDARRLIDAGATVALATDCNPGSSYTTSMPLCIALAVREMAMTPAEAVWSATAGGAAALRRTDIGNLSIGSRANLIVLDAPSSVHLAYRPGVNLIDRVFVDGIAP